MKRKVLVGDVMDKKDLEIYRRSRAFQDFIESPEFLEILFSNLSRFLLKRF